MDPALHELMRTGEGDDVVPAIVRIDPREPLPAQVRIVARFGDIATVRLKRGDVPEAYASDAIASLKATRLLMPEPVDSHRENGVDASHSAESTPSVPAGFIRRDPSWPRGGGTVIAALDWGLDFSHPEFRRADGRTRIDALWDQGATYDPAFPNAYGYGRVYRKHEIDRALGAERPFIALGYDPRRADRGNGTHATHVLGIAAGSARVGPGGIAPDAAIVFVELAPATGRSGRRALTDSAAVLEALHFVDVEAAARPACINMSLGTHGGPHDGTALVEQGIDAFLAASPRRVVVQSTGNYFAKRVHAGGTLAPGERTSLPMLVDREDVTANDLEVWYRGCDTFRAHVQAPDGRIVATADRGQIQPVLDGDVEIGRLYHRERDPNNHDHHIQLRLDAPAAVGRWTLVLEGVHVEDGRYDAWIERDTQCPSCQPSFPRDRAATGSTTGSICNGHRSIVVGAYDAHAPDLRLGAFSSSGPTRDGRGKPDLVAPGVRVLSARSTPRNARAGGARLATMSGTSMAAPHVTGAAALILEIGDGAFDNARVRDLLRATARPDPQLDPTDRLRFGAGRLDVGAALAAAHAAVAARSLPTPEIAMETVSSPTCACAAAHGRTEAESADERVAPGIVADATEADYEIDEATGERRERRYYDGPMIAPVIGVGGLGVAMVAPLGGGIGIAVPIAGSPTTTTPAPAPAAAALPPLPPEPASQWGAPVAVASTEPTLRDERERSDEGVWVVSERDAAHAAQSWNDAGARYSSPVIAEAWDDATAREHIDEYDELAEAAISVDPRMSAAAFVADLLGRAGATALHPAFDEHRHDVTALPARLYDHFCGHRRVLPDALVQRFDVVALPGTNAPLLAAGDLLLRRGEGGFAHVAVLAAPDVWPASALHRNGFRIEHAFDGGFVHVIEPGPTAARRADRRARRLCDATQRLLPDTLVLRLQPGLPRPRVASEGYDETVDARWIQTALNRILGIDLTVDGAIGAQTRAAIRAFQHQHGLAADGVVGPRTESALRDAMGGDAGAGLPTRLFGGLSSLPPISGVMFSPSAARVTSTSSGASDCTTLDAFDQGRDALQPAHHTLLIGIARRIQREGIRLVEITGFASSEGDDGSNLALGMRRAISVGNALRETLERIRPGSGAGVTMVPLSRGESDQIAGGDPARNRRVDVCLRTLPVPQPEVPTHTRTFTVTGKSFIATVGSNIGSLDCGIPIGPVTIPGASNIGLRALAAATDAAFQENPTNDRIFVSPPPENKGYRLFSQGRVQAMTRGTQLINLSLDSAGLITDTGKECLPGTPVCLTAPPMRIDQPFATRRLGPSRVQFRWKVAGEPHRDAKRPFDIICDRPSVFIWHEIVGTIDSSSGTPEIINIFIQGSRFPSHRLWVDNVVAGNVRQHEFSALWDGTPGDPTRVR